jgi:hypothetical protein
MELKDAFNSETGEADEQVVVRANESEHNPQQASLKTLTGVPTGKQHFFGFVRSYSYSYDVLPEYFLPHSRKLLVFLPRYSRRSVILVGPRCWAVVQIKPASGGCAHSRSHK